jgi:endonuclease YncB( thermonuclease family)
MATLNILAFLKGYLEPLMVLPILSRRQIPMVPVVLRSLVSRLVLVTGTAALATGVSAQESCKLTDLGTVTVARVRDGRTLLLTDGRELRLAAIEADDASRATLNALAAGKTLRLEALGRELDRYGRVVAFAYADGAGESLQQVMLTQGQARVAARVGNRPCAELLLRAERAARATVRGLWADPNFAPLPSHDTIGITAVRGQFALVEGKVLSVRESGATIYVNFGWRRTQDFSVTILKRHRRDFAAAGVEPKELEGRRIRVRGWVEQRHGPMLEASVPEQIEVVR